MLSNWQLICTVTPSSSNSEETHNTLKFAHRAKHIEIQAAQNKVCISIFLLRMSSSLLFSPFCQFWKFLCLQIIDEKSLIKKYQNEIRCLKEELEQLRRGIVTVPQLKDIGEEDLVLLKQKVHSYSFPECFCFLLGSFLQPWMLKVPFLGLWFHYSTIIVDDDTLHCSYI